MKKILFCTILMLLTVAAAAQKREITGTILDQSSKEPIPLVTVQLLKTDSTFVTGTVSTDSGRFVLNAPASERYLLRFTSVGYRAIIRHVQVAEDHNVDMGKVTMLADAIMLKGAQITAQAQKVVLKEDTFIYNSAAYRTPEGSTIEQLVKRLPGAQVDESGKITINGKEVKKILVDGKEFMTGDTKTAMKNIPTSIIDRVKAYDQQSDLTRVTGIDDGEEQTVLDFNTKQGMNKGLMANVDVSMGTRSRYSERLFGGYFNKDMRVFGMGSANNVNDMGFGWPGGRFGGGRNGLNATKMAGVNLNYEKKDKLKIDGSLRWNHNNGDVYSKQSTESFVSTVGAFSNSMNQTYSRGNSFNGQAKIEWTPDTLTNLLFRPTISVSTSDGLLNRRSAAFKVDPYTFVSDPLSAASLTALANDSVVVNSALRNNISYSKAKTFGMMAQLNRKLSSNGRNVTLRGDVDYTNSDARDLSLNNVHLYLVKDILGIDSTYQTNRYSLTPSTKWDYSLQTTYSEPLWKGVFLQMNYKFRYSYNKSDRSTYDFSNLGESYFSGVEAGYRQWNGYLDRLANPYTSYFDCNLSRYSVYKNYTHTAELMLRMIRSKWRLNVGVMMRPQYSHYVQDYQGISVDTTRSVFNVSPTLDFRYKFSKTSKLRINYRGKTTQPTISQLLAVRDESDPLNISTGNPGLKPAFTQSLRLFYDSYSEKKKRAMMTFLDFSTTNNAISNSVTYNEATGGLLSRPENINGNWNFNSAFMINTPIDSAGRWSVNSFTDLNYAHNVGYVSLSRLASSQKNTTHDMVLGERLSGSYRNDWLEVELNGALNYRYTRSKLQSTVNMDTWQYSYGANINLTAPWGTSLSTSLNMNSRRGYNDKSLNTNELIWNAQISHGFLKGKSLVVMLQFYDLLQRQSNISRSITASMRSDAEYNSINSYAMLHINYKLNLFGTKESRRGMEGPGFGPGDRKGPKGGFGGDRPPRGGFGGPRF